MSYPELRIRFGNMDRYDMAIYVEFTPEMAGNGKWYGDIPPTRNAPKNCGNGKARVLDSLL